MSVADCRERVGPREFVGWQHYLILEEEDKIRASVERKTRTDFQLAAVAQQVYDLTCVLAGIFNVQLPPQPLDRFMVDITIPDAVHERPKEMTDDEYREARVTAMRAVAACMKRGPLTPSEN
jgi:hypothetical protein